MKAEVKREHRELAVVARYPHAGVPAPESWAHQWVEGKFTGFGADEDCLNAIAQALADLEATVEARVRRELTEDAWAVGVLDAWADAYGTQWHCGQSIRGTGFFVCRLQADGADPTRPKDFIANSAAAARWCAANDLAHWDNRFPRSPREVAAAHALTPSISLPETAGEKEDSNG